MSHYKRTQILQHVQKHGQITKAEAVTLIGSDYYTNADFHVGAVLSRTVDAGLLERIKPGLFKAGRGNVKSKPAVIDAGQKELFV